MTAITAAVADCGGANGHIQFLGRLDRYLRERKALRDSCGLIVVQICNLNRINTTAGYRAGHQLSRNFTTALHGMLRDNDWLMPLSDSRYGIVLDQVRNTGHVMLAASRVARIAADFASDVLDGSNLEIRAGVALYPEHGNSAELLLRHGEMAIETAIREQASFAVYRPETSRQITDEWDLESELRSGLENSEFQLCYQPKLDARTRRPCGAEALLRWNNPRIGEVSPDRFIPVAERGELIDELTNFCLHSAARDAAEWQAHGYDLHVAVNLSPMVIERGSIVSTIEHVAAIWGLGVDRFVVEVTENGIISTAGAALRVLHELQDAGVRVSIDDFGTGNSSLAYFKDIPANEIKIDKSFVLSMLEIPANHRLVSAIIELAHGFNLAVVAEGVETEQCALQLQQLGCDQLQGFYFSKPRPQKEFLQYLRDVSVAAS